jgi:hypothetical protein
VQGVLEFLVDRGRDRGRRPGRGESSKGVIVSSELQGLKNALGFGVSMIAAEHFISAGMSSPWSVAKFAQTQQDEDQVWKLFFEAGGASIVSAITISWLIGSREVFFWSLVGAISVMLFVGYEYKRALEGTL